MRPIVEEAGENLLIIDAEVDGERRIDLRIRDGKVTEIRRNLRLTDDRIVDAEGGAVIPGLHDHHVHLLSLAAALDSVYCGPPHVKNAAEFAYALRSAREKTSPGEWIRGIGYHKSVAGELDRWQLDSIVPDRPVRIQDRSGALWILNSAAVRALELDFDQISSIDERHAIESVNGRLFRADGWVHSYVGSEAIDLGRVGHLMSRYGVTAVADATPNLDQQAIDALSDASASGALPQRLLALGLPLQHASRLLPGPYKIFADEALGLDFYALSESIATCHAMGRPVAIHCVTKAEITVSVQAVAEAGPLRGDRLEHASEMPFALDRLARQLGLTIVTQPNFVWERGDTYAIDVPKKDHDLLYRCGSLLKAGIQVAAGTDAPFGNADPWKAMEAAVRRRTYGGRSLGRGERISGRHALRLFLGSLLNPGSGSLHVKPGDEADLCILTEPLADAVKALHNNLVRGTIIAGRLIYEC